MIIVPHIDENSYYIAQSFHFELYFDIEVLRQQLELQDSFGLFQRCHLEHLMTPKEFFYSRVAMDFYQTMTTRDVPIPTTIHFIIDGR